MLLEISLNFKPLIPLLDFGMVQSLCSMLGGLLTVENVGVKDGEHFEIYFVLAAVWASQCGRPTSKNQFLLHMVSLIDKRVPLWQLLHLRCIIGYVTQR